MKKRSQAGYRWFDHLILQMSDGRRKYTWRHHRDILNSLLNPPPLMISSSEEEQYQELEKTPEERICLRIAFEAVNCVLKKHGQPQMRFRQNMVHILPDNKDVRAVLQCTAIAELGQVCMIRQTSPMLTLFIAVHELMHLAALNILFLNEPMIVDGEPTGEPDFIIMRSGFDFIYKERRLFWALNEAVTQMLAKEARRAIPINRIADLQRMNDECDAEMESQAIVLAIATKLAENHGVRRYWIKAALAEDYLTGTHYFLQKLYLHWPEAAITLSHLENEPLTIAQAADRLGFPTLAETIRYAHRPTS